MKPTNELTTQELLCLAETFERRLLTILKKELEKPGGPKLSYEHLDLLGLTSDFAFNGKAEATETKKCLEKSVTDIKKLEVNLNSVPQNIHRRLSDFSKLEMARRSPVTEKQGKSPFFSTLETMQAEIEAELQRVEFERKLIWSGPGNTFNANARYVAWKVAEIHLFLRGEAPTKISKSNEDCPSSPYTRAVDGVFRMLGIETTFISPCRHVTKVLKNGQGFPEPDPTPILSLINDPDFIAGTNMKK